MATIVGLTRGQIKLMAELREIELGLKSLYEELEGVSAPPDTLAQFSQIHNRYTSAIGFLLRQRQLGEGSRDQATVPSPSHHLEDP
jgi:hypothetical protein